ncbi:hypothetical protein SARC_05024 [Sphaeroforma arctica JP610]|uniref:Uncharacterized protein n=1 Tax=Sphaeroforma arctica JP610 TaxID=667725 RepID=A0A0L0G0U5_9EUKA|nr:hypothetical protein SARC_05024 [Sphaeroforma arctica JP610]KNC82685.1 hypothetical protein SARC_05024 [Sphaeroforma arctica JP610]|eukprot:XP_014156587.1 hypothetical protein SARC_05024 [Sphaeroforma arctica JP610]
MTYPTFVFITPVHAGESTPETDEPKGNAAYMQLYFDSMSMLRTVYEPIADKESVVTHMIFKEIIAGLRVVWNRIRRCVVFLILVGG